MHCIYLDHQATTPVDHEVEDVMKAYWREQFGNPHAEHVVGRLAGLRVEQVRATVAETLFCDPSEIFFTSGATEANNQSIFGVCASASLEIARKRVIVSAIEHKCVHEAARYWCEIFGLELKVVGVDRYGFVDLSELEDLLKIPTRLVSVMSVNNEIGTIQHLQELSHLAWNAGSVLHSDSAQAPKAMLELSPSKFSDLATFSAHKLGGPPGIGAIYIASHLQSKLSPLIRGGGQQNGMRAGTVSLPLAVGLGKAFALLSDKTSAQQSLRQMRERTLFFYNLLKSKVPDISLNGPAFLSRHPGNLNICFHYVGADELLLKLNSTVAASSGSACNSGSIEPSHVLRAIGLNEKDAKSSIRFSFSPHSTFDDLEVATLRIADIIGNR